MRISINPWYSTTMEVINIILSIVLIILLIKTPFVTTLNQKVGGSEDYKSRYEKERTRSQTLEKKIAGLEESLKGPGDYQKQAPAFGYDGTEIFRIVNEYRRNSNVGELALDSNLCYLANLRLSQLLEGGKLDAHKGFTDFNPAEKFKYERVGENLAYGYATAGEVVGAWEKSPGHNLNLKDPVNTLGCVAANRGFAVLIAGKEN